MKCPACGHTMTETTIRDITVDVCQGGCGGLWFDWLELKKVDEQHEAIGAELLEVDRNAATVVDHEKKRDCPHCEDVVMMRHFTSVKRDVEIDECGGCGGVFLDHGELNGLRTEFTTEEERSEAAQELFASLYDEGLEDLKDDSAENVSKAKGLARMFRFLLPSWYLPGKQKWGSY